MKITRREWLSMTAGAGAAAMGGLGSLQADGSLIEVVVPSSGVRLPAVGIGTVGFRGDPGTPEMQRYRQTLEAFHRAGGRLLDTSPNYGNSEEVLGRLLAETGLRDRVFMATKVDREDAAEGRERMAGCFERLGPPIDLMQVHNLRGTEAQLETLFAWKSEGRIGHVGVTTHRVGQHGEVEEVMRKHPLDFIQVNYSLADRAAAERLLPLAQDRGVAVLVNRPFGKGQLFAAVSGPELPDWAVDIDCSSWGQVFLKYVISHPAATIPIPGTTKPHHAEDNAGALYGRLPDGKLRAHMEAFFDQRIAS